MKQYAIIFSAALLSACAAEAPQANRSGANAADPQVAPAVRAQCERESVMLYPVVLSTDAGFRGPMNHVNNDVPEQWGPHPAAFDSNAEKRTLWVHDCLLSKGARQPAPGR